MILEKIQADAERIAGQRQLALEWQWTHHAKTVECNSNIQILFKNAASLYDVNAPYLPSGAGHDAMALAKLCPIGMLFIRSPGGISHHPSETVIESDIAKSIAVLFSAFRRLKASP